MKKTLLALALAVSALPALAQYTGPGPQPITVKQLQASGHDDQFVVLRGHLTRQISGERYQFSDGTGTLLVKIDTDRWPAGSTVNDKNTVELAGQYDKEIFGTPKLKVKRIQTLP
jgi:uncharacterized protein (TIGR00156 family)